MIGFAMIILAFIGGYIAGYAVGKAAERQIKPPWYGKT